MDELPEDIIFRLNLCMDYLTLISFYCTSEKYYRLCGDRNFWLSKSIYDFPVTGEEFAEIYQITEKGQNAYLWLAGRYGKPLPGAERYGNLKNLAIAATQTNNISLIQYFFTLSQEPKMIFYLAKQNRSDIIYRLPIYQRTPIHDEMLFGAAEGGHLDLIDKIIYQVNPVSIPVAIEYAVKGGNLSVIEYLYPMVNQYGERHIPNRLLAIAAKCKYSSILDYALKLGANDYSAAVIAASRVQDLPIINRLIALGNIPRDAALHYQLMGASSGGYKEWVSELIDQGAVHLNQAMVRASEGHHLDIVEDLIHRGGTYFTASLRYGIDDMRITKLLLSYGAEVDYDIMYKAAYGGNSKIFNLVYSVYKGGFMNDILSLAAECGHLDIVHYLIAKNPDLNIDRAIVRAGEKNNLNVVYYLLKYNRHHLANAIADIFPNRKVLGDQLRKLFAS